MKHFFVFVLISIAIGAQPRWDDTLDHELVEQQLTTGKIMKVMDLREYLAKKGVHARPTHQVFFVQLENGLKGVFKQGAYRHGEVAAYRASKALGLRLVPPTVYRTIKGKKGSLQFLIEAPSISGVSTMKRLEKKVGKKAVCDMKLFYYVFGQWDIHAGNQLVASYDGKDYLALIDNSVMLHRTYDTYGGATFTSKGKNFDLPSVTGTEFPYDAVEVIPGRKVHSVFKPYVGSAERHRLSRYGKCAYVIWNHRLYLKLSKRLKARFTKTFYEETLDAYRALDAETVATFWEGLAEDNQDHAAELCEIIVAKRDEILAYAQNKGTILSHES